MKLAFDTGGTFTDFAFSDDDGSILLHKVLSTPDAPARAVLQGVDELLAKVRKGKGTRPGEGALQILGATTVVTNAVLERKGVDTAFITTDGFQDCASAPRAATTFTTCGSSTPNRWCRATAASAWPSGSPPTARS